MSLSLVSYVGGKGTHLDDLLPLIPFTTTFVEPYGGAASILLNRRRSEVEVYNDLNDDLVNLFRVVRDPLMGPEFEAMVDATLYSRAEFRRAVDIVLSSSVSPLDRAWATFVIHNQGISGKLHRSYGNWARSRESDINSRRWWGKYDRLNQIRHRMEHVQIESRDALHVIETWDGPETTFYLDPPYVLETRGGRSYYAFEQPIEHHEQLVELLLEIQGCVVLSGYDHEVYEPLSEAGWTVDAYSKSAVTAVAEVGGTKPGRVEVVWRNPRCLMHGAQMPLFTESTNEGERDDEVCDL